MASLDITVNLDLKESLACLGLKDPEDTLDPRDLMVFQVKWVPLAPPPWNTVSW